MFPRIKSFLFARLFWKKKNDASLYMYIGDRALKLLVTQASLGKTLSGFFEQWWLNLRLVAMEHSWHNLVKLLQSV